MYSIKYKSLSLLTVVGIFMTGCGKIPPLPAKDELKKMSFHEFMLSQNYQSYKPHYMITEKQLSLVSAENYLLDRHSALITYCRAFDGKVISKEKYLAQYLSIPLGSSMKATNDIIDEKYNQWNNFQDICVVNSLPYFAYIKNTIGFTASIRTREILPISDIFKKDTSLLNEQDINKIKIKSVEYERQYTEKVKHYKLKEQQAKEQKEKELNTLRNRKGSNVMTFFDNYRCDDNTIADGHAMDMRIAVYNSWTKALSFTPSMCQSICQEKNEKYTGYTDLQKALNDRWLFVSKQGVKEYREGNCLCTGFQYILRK